MFVHQDLYILSETSINEQTCSPVVTLSFGIVYVFLKKSLQKPWIYIFNCTKKGKFSYDLLKNVHTHSLHAALVKCLGSSTRVSRIIIIYCKRLVPWLRQIVTGLLEWRRGFSSRSGHVPIISDFLCKSHSTNATYLLIISTVCIFTIQCN